MNNKEIRKDLKEIKYYYLREKDLQLANKIMGSSQIVEKIEKYNDIVKTMPPQLLDIYLGLYVQGETQENLAEEMGFCVDYIRKKNKNLITYLSNAI